MTERTLSLYGAGGAGSNQVKPFIGVSTLPGYAKMACTLIDTSDSNITDRVPEENVFILDGVDGSGKVREGVSTEALKNYYSTIEETRADLFALYYIMDEKMMELGLVPSIEAAKAEFDAYLRNGLLTQLTRIESGKDIEESHMRNRQLIARWAYEAGKAENVVEFFKKDGKTFVRINDYLKLRNLFGQLLKEIQRIKSEGDFEAARNLVESYAVKVDRPLHDEILLRFKKLDLAPYAGFLNPIYELKTWPCGTPNDVLIRYDEDYTSQMLRYSNEYGFLPIEN